MGVERMIVRKMAGDYVGVADGHWDAGIRERERVLAMRYLPRN